MAHPVGKPIEQRLEQLRRPYGKGPLVNASDVEKHFARAYQVRLSAATVRQWASRRRIGSYGSRRERYDIREVVAYAVRRGVIPGKSIHTEGA